MHLNRDEEDKELWLWVRFFQFIWERDSENSIKIGPYLPKLLQEKFGAVFGQRCIYTEATVAMVKNIFCQNSAVNRSISAEFFTRNNDANSHISDEIQWFIGFQLSTFMKDM